MLELTPEECRVLGVLIEKGQTTPAQYPLSLNGIANGCSQKSNRNPVVDYDEEAVMDTLDGLRSKNLCVLVDMASSRVLKYKHNARETLAVATGELVLLAELMLRGPQTIGELRTRASRMHPIESLQVAESHLGNLMERTEPLVRRLPPAPGSRAERFAQLLCPDLHPLDAAPAPSPTAAPAASPDLEARVERLETEVAELRRMIEAMRG